MSIYLEDFVQLLAEKGVKILLVKVLQLFMEETHSVLPFVSTTKRYIIRHSNRSQAMYTM
jgi:hypothetical protein